MYRLTKTVGFHFVAEVAQHIWYLVIFPDCGLRLCQIFYGWTCLIFVYFAFYSEVSDLKEIVNDMQVSSASKSE